MTVIVGRKSSTSSSLCTIFSASVKDSDTPKYEFTLPNYPGDVTSEPVATDYPKWTRYVIGVVALMNKDCDIPAFEAVINTCVPLGGGVSSSAALEVATALFVEKLREKGEGSKVDLALLCQQAEHRYAGEG